MAYPRPAARPSPSTTRTTRSTPSWPPCARSGACSARLRSTFLAKATHDGRRHDVVAGNARPATAPARAQRTVAATPGRGTRPAATAVRPVPAAARACGAHQRARRDDPESRAAGIENRAMGPVAALRRRVADAAFALASVLDLMSTLPELTFRDATIADVPAVVALVESAYRGDVSRQGWTTEADLLGGRRTGPDDVLSCLERPRSRIVLAEDGGELLACAHVADDDGAGYFGMFSVQPGLQ